MKKMFANRVAFVTGGSFGIGRATALAFARNGAQVCVADWSDDHSTVELIKSEGGDAIHVHCNVRNAAEVEAAVKATVTAFGRLDYAFNNAGVEGGSASTHECTEENWDDVLDINLKGVWLCMKYQIPAMMEHGKGAIVNCASVAGLVGFAGLPAYCASKHGIVGLTKGAAIEYAKTGLRINAVCPGVIRTPMIDRFTGKDKAAEKAFEDMEPVGRMGEPEEVAEAVIWLCADASSFVTGHALAVDGGWIAK